MQLKSLEIFGFKSFADRTKLAFDKGITGIVGPNGCGKSNVVDSIRWVLGEQRTRNLRSDKMENIIFNGSKDRRKANFAEVSLHFENTRNLLPSEYSSVAITRRLYRSGESEYLLNGVACRLKDIHDLFMDTGISSDSYAIIELKMVDEILTDKDQDRRRFFEEAAGISKYKIRKKQTLKRLEETDGDLARVEDLLHEITQNMKSLEKQAKRTEKYFEVKEKYRDISARYAREALRDIVSRQETLEKQQRGIENELIEAQTALATREARMLELRRLQTDHEAQLAEAQADLNRHVRRIQTVETEKSIKNERLKYLQQREIAIQNQLETDRKQADKVQLDLVRLRQEHETLQKETATIEAVEVESRKQMEASREAQQSWQSRLNTLMQDQRDKEQELQTLTREVEIRRVQVESLEGELRRAEEESSQRHEDLDAFAEKGAALQSECGILEQQVADLREKKETHARTLRETEDLLTRVKDTVYKTNRILDAKQNEYNLTKSLVENLEGFPASVKFLKTNAKWMKQAPLLSDIFAVSEEYKIALENYLDAYLSYYVVPTREDAHLSIQLLADSAKGRANFFVMDELEEYRNSTPLLFTQAIHALDVVDFAPEYRKLAAYLLDKVYFVAEEQNLPSPLPEGVMFLTKSGGLSRRKYQMGGGSLGLFEGKRLGRAKNLEALEKELSKLQKQLSTEKLELENAQRSLEGLRKIDFSKELEPLAAELNQKQRDLSVLQSREKEYREFLARVGQRSESLEQELDKLRSEIGRMEPEVKYCVEELQIMSTRVASHQGEARAAAEAAEHASHAYNQEHIRLIHIRNQLANVDKELEQKSEQAERLGQSEEKLREELHVVRKDTSELVNANLQDDEVMVGLYQDKKQKEERVDRHEQQLANTKSSIHQVEDGLTEARRQREQVLQRQNKLREEETQVKIDRHSLQERMSVEFQIDIDAILLQMGEAEREDTESLRDQMLRLRNQVQNFGEINPLAVEAYNEIKERHDFIISQRQDLLDAKQSLLDTIAEIDLTAKEKFLETFGLVREHFQKVFRSLFSADDSCDLILEDPDNPLESEINIIARPKGKRPQTIKQLSGGEKTLTAVALLFSIYLIKPAPFCIFDEVDAPLDDANIDKFNNIIREFSSTSQFIIVTHNKRTMASTNVMYGVTMENQGVSRVLPVDLVALSLN